MPDEPLPPRTGWLATLGWAVYLACSWTWCIGMFLPVLLERDFGAWGFVVFAVPNILGAAAMGWVLARPGSSERLVARHRAACRTFSLVTVAFQLYAVLLFTGVFGAAIMAWPAALAVGAGWRGGTRVLATAAAVYLLSLVALVVWLATGRAALPPGPPELPPTDVLWLAPVSAFGFLLCPYLDLTFHRARRSTARRAGIAAFTIGFVALFPAMILLTLACSGWSLAQTVREGSDLSFPAVLLALHVLVQLGFTVTVHLRELPARGEDSAGDTFLSAGVLAIAIAWVAGLVAVATVGIGFPLLETGYRIFMAFYGLVFPAYVWLLVIPTRDGHAGTDGPTGRRKLLIWCFAVGVAAPMFWMGFIERQTGWLAPGLGLVLLARLFLPRSAAR